MLLLPTGTELQLPTVQLRHVLPDGSHHVDWFIAREQAHTSPLLSFRLAESLASLRPGVPMTAVHMQDHRRAYLSYQGEVSGGRGTVTRIAEGLLTDCQADASGCWRLWVDWGDHEQALTLKHDKCNEYHVFLLA